MEQEMKYVYAVYKHGNFSKAASSLYMTQPALSIAIQRVEKSIGMPLFDRSKKPLKLTEAGELYIKKYKQIQQMEHELAQQLNDLSELNTGSLRIGGSHYFNSYILPPVLTKYKKKHPGIQLELLEAGSNDLLNILSEHEIDVTFNCTIKPKDSFHRIPGFIDTILISVPRNMPINDRLQDYALSAKDIIDKKHQDFSTPALQLDAFSELPFILLTPGNNLYSRSTTFFNEAHIIPNVCLQVSQLVTAYHLSRFGMGATFISDLLVSPEHDSVLFYKIDSPLSIRVFDLVMSNGSYMSNAMKEFIRMFQAQYGLHLDKREPSRKPLKL
ncbi:MAG: LysR family transcriptional regulator [Clostridia bacterium]|nr:LysR family transcriptional regulator [Clostridia bacterium]NCC44247.1 LysR family transcriptional regulator [Clostridia bacterium]